MRSFAYYFHQYWLSGLLITGALVAIFFVYRYWDRIIIRSSGRK